MDDIMFAMAITYPSFLFKMAAKMAAQVVVWNQIIVSHNEVDIQTKTKDCVCSGGL